MTDHFALLSEPRRPWLDADALKAKFLALSAAAHPDRVAASGSAAQDSATSRFAELNAAHQCLRETRDRLQHLLALETGTEPRTVRAISPDLADLIIPAEQLCRDVSAFLAEKSKATSPLLKVALFERGMEWTDQITSLQSKLAARRAQLDAELQSLNATWAALDFAEPSRRRAELPLTRLEEIYRAYSYLTRYAAQLQERFVQLAM